MAKENPETLVIGIDSCHQNLIELSAKAAKKPQKGGLSNLLFILANVENLPDELSGIADKVYINFPWGSLLQAVVLTEESAWNSIKKICKPNAIVQIIFGYDILHDKKEIERLGLPILDIAYINNHMVPNLAKFGFELANIKQLKPQDLSNYPTTWAKKLSFGSDRSYYQLVFKKQ